MHVKSEFQKLFAMRHEIVALPPDKMLIGDEEYYARDFAEYIQTYLESQDIHFLDDLEFVASNSGYVGIGSTQIKDSNPIIFAISFPGVHPNEVVKDIEKDYPELVTGELGSHISAYLDMPDHVVIIVIRLLGELLKKQKKYPRAKTISIGMGTRLYKDSKKFLTYPDLGAYIMNAYFSSIDNRMVVYVAESYENPKISKYMYDRHNQGKKSALRYQEAPTFEEVLNKISKLYLNPLL